jgi:hypothetical protein
MRRRARLLAALLAATALLCAAMALISVASARRIFRSHEATVLYTLDQRQIAYEAVEFRQSTEEHNDFDFFRASVRVHLPNGQIASGAIGCEDRDRGCVLDVVPLGIRGPRLPELTRAAPLPPWLVWAERTLRRVAERVL